MSSEKSKKVKNMGYFAIFFEERSFSEVITYCTEESMTCSNNTKTFEEITATNLFFFNMMLKNPQKQLFLKVVSLCKKLVASILVSVPNIFAGISCSVLKTMVSIKKLISKR